MDLLTSLLSAPLFLPLLVITVVLLFLQLLSLVLGGCAAASQLCKLCLAPLSDKNIRFVGVVLVVEFVDGRDACV